MIECAWCIIEGSLELHPNLHYPSAVICMYGWGLYFGFSAPLGSHPLWFWGCWKVSYGYTIFILNGEGVDFIQAQGVAFKCLVNVPIQAILPPAFVGLVIFFSATILSTCIHHHYLMPLHVTWRLPMSKAVPNTVDTGLNDILSSEQIHSNSHTFHLQVQMQLGCMGWHSLPVFIVVLKQWSGLSTK